MNNEIRKSKQSSKNHDDAMMYYLKEINKIPLLSREDEEKTAQEAAKGSRTAKEKLINANLRFVIKIAKKYQGRGIPLEDLINEGNIGLCRAVDHFDASRGIHFISYAVWWIRQSIMLAIVDKSRAIRIPLLWNHAMVQIEAFKNKLPDNRITGTNLPDIAKYLGLSNEKVTELLMFGQDVLSLEQPVHEDGNASTIGDFLESNTQISPENYAIISVLKSDIEKMLKILSPREAEIIRARFGLEGAMYESLEELGVRFNISKEGIRQIESKALRCLRQAGLCHRLEPYTAA